jgi:dolichol-phosphate mannosyltransferase
LEENKKKINVAAVIPFYNEEKTIYEVIKQTLAFVDIVIAVNDGSTDKSVDKIKNMDRMALIDLKKNHSKGYALNEGFKKSIEINSEITLTLDADLQHPPEFIPGFLNAVNDFDIVIGNRKKRLGVMPIQRIISNKLTSFLLSKKTGQKILDGQCGYRLYKTKILKDILPASSGYEAESEILIKASRCNYKISFVDISVIYGEQESKMKAWRTIKGFLKVLLKG